ncbi:MAG: sigma-70 family RNA polymerase sigma factor [Anaerolineae bacterium]|nr:sigma-70 family RNA polymerase sigma factor [Phycisphaerae bacterium]
MSENYLPSDSDLLTEFAESGSERPFEVLVRRHGALVLSVCRGILRDANDAEDAAQAAFLTLARKAKSLIGHRTIAGWLHTVAWHISCRARRARTLRQHREREAAEAAIQHAHGDSAHTDTSLLHEQLHAMPDKYRLPLILHHFDGWSEAEVAQILGCKLGTISGRLSRGRQILKERLVARGLGTAIAVEPVDAMERDRRRAAPAAAFVAIASRAGSMIQRKGGVTEGAASTQAAALSDGLLRGMRRSKIRAIVAAAVVFAIVVGSIVGLMAFYAAPPSIDDGDATAAPSQMYFPRVARADNSIVGVLLDPGGKPAAKVLVRLYMKKSDASEGRRALGWARTRTDGSFVIDNVPPGKAHFLLCNTTDQPTFMHANAYVNIEPFQTVNVGTLTLKTGRY